MVRRWLSWIALVPVAALILGASCDRTGVVPPSSTSPVPTHDGVIAVPAVTGEDEERADTVERTLASIWFVDLGTGRARPLPRSIRAVPGATHVQASPDGTRLTFEGDRGIYLADLEGRAIQRLPGTGRGRTPAWSPDGRQVVFSTWRAILVVDVRSGSISRPFGGARPVLHPTFSPDGGTILFTNFSRRGLELWTVPAEGGAATRLTSWGGSEGSAFGGFGPTGSIAYRRTGYAGVDVTQMTEGRVWVMRADGTHGHPVSPPAAWMSQIDPEGLWPAWSPDGTRIAYEHLYQRGVRVVDVRTRRVARIGDGMYPAWLDDDTLIVEAYRPVPER